MGLIHNYNKDKHDVYLYEGEGLSNIFSSFIIPATGEKWNIPYRLLDTDPDGNSYKYPVFLWDRNPDCPVNHYGPIDCEVIGDRRKATPIGYNPNCIAFTNPINGVTPDFSGRDAPLRGAGSNRGEHPLHNMRWSYDRKQYEITGWPGSEMPGDDVFTRKLQFDSSIPGYTWEYGIRDPNVPYHKNILNINNWNNGMPGWFVISKRHVLGCRHFIGEPPIDERRTVEIRLIGKNNETYIKHIKPRKPEDGLPNRWYDFVIYEFVDENDFPTDLRPEEQQQIKQYKLINCTTIPSGVGVYVVNPSGTFAGLKSPTPFISGIDLSTGKWVWDDFDFSTNIDGSNFLSDSSIFSGLTYATKLIPDYPIYAFVSNFNEQFIRKRGVWRERGIRRVWTGHSSTQDKLFITYNGETYLTIPAFDLGLTENYNPLNGKKWLKSIFEADGEDPNSRLVLGSYEPIQYATGYEMPLQPIPYRSRFKNPTFYISLMDYTFNNNFPEEYEYLDSVLGSSDTKKYNNVIWHGFFGAASLQSQELNEMQESIANQSSRYSNIMANWLEVHENEIINGVSGGFISESDPLVPLWPEYFSQNLNPRENEPGWYMIKDDYGFYHYCYIHNLLELENELQTLAEEFNIRVTITPPCDYNDISPENKAICLWNRKRYLVGYGKENRYKNLRDIPSSETLDSYGAHRIYSVQNINFREIL